MRLLIVEDNASLGAALADALADRWRDGGGEVAACRGVAEAVHFMQTFEPDAVLVDVSLPDGTAGDIVRAASAGRPTPAFVAMSGVASPREAFELAQLGVRGYLAKPVTLDEVERALGLALAGKPDLVPHLRAAVGLVPLKELEQVVRETMVSEALAKSGGSRRAAARLLDVSRQLLQYMLRGASDRAGL